ncbi:hypothetical protein ASE06_19165 [Sphingopyxis sp. Root214]|jgi:hypothetical protein|uniref:hypothetical protein n=1 Tax=unclassified Sphingopyxis TaxID=2614943 RepID=UPI0006FF8683|nr:MULTISPECIES: hypothetical protein [unclassified Sphingopyxis]KQZ71535.1 hypothetical protein ASD73_16830 [Sphingopyxis sp. Root154]KRC05444.1 hypothetical protein ASE06_19165 [Sphingopyxis sp. Root214]
MARKLSFAASRRTGARLFRWWALALAGVIGGALLGEMAVGTRLGGGGSEPASYSRLSANPDALAPQGSGAAPCLDCADSYGVAIRLRAHRDEMMSDDAFRELGAVDVDPPILADVSDDYRYGGRFPDPEPAAAATGEDPPTDMPAGEASPPDITKAPVPAEY